MHMSKSLDRRGFLAVIGLSAGAAVTVVSASGAIAATTRPSVTKSRTENLFRKGVFPRGSQWSIPGGDGKKTFALPTVSGAIIATTGIYPSRN
ncbi:MAG: hypothetical protein K0U42_00870 [Actinomycetia bacterium]|nr:hypothetical protein [Actinomycetes bacterium]